ncbi:MFS transporter [Amycolatopsis sp. QT-25]|uniref:MFS transporter n=1 Tax=Amycolatopsis sp. QT-25 TaxID=3034022 RepID=UPI0023EB1674|nr:MFS transporter [Amycolatopsis sp. QT-25]WET81648.1 MFS transporter [Amycolatopsis sp. QT-25]
MLNSAGFAADAALLVAIAGSHRPVLGRATSRPVLAELRDGLRWIRGGTLLLRLILIIGAISMVYEIALAQLVLYVLEHLRLNESAFGLFGAISGIGGLAGALLAPRLIAWWGRRTVLTGGLLAAGVCVAGMGLTADPVLASALYGVFGIPVMAVNIVSATVRHTAVPEPYLGRVLGAWRTVVFGTIPLGALAGGLLAKATPGTTAVFVTSGVLQVVLACVAWLLLRRFGPGLTPGPSSVHTGQKR